MPLSWPFLTPMLLVLVKTQMLVPKTRINVAKKIRMMPPAAVSVVFSIVFRVVKRSRKEEGVQPAHPRRGLQHPSRRCTKPHARWRAWWQGILERNVAVSTCPYRYAKMSMIREYPINKFVNIFQ